MGSSAPSARPEQPSRVGVLAVVTILVPYTLGLGLFVATAMAIYARRDLSLPAAVDHHLLTAAWITLAVALTVAAFLLRRLGVDPRQVGIGAPRRPRLALWEAVPLAYLSMWGGKQAFELFGEHIRVSPGLPGAWSVWEIVSYCLHTALAEELLIVAIPVAVLTTLRVPLRCQVLVVFALRLLIHAYYGWPAIVLAAVWTLLLMAVYVRYRSISPFIAIHALFDLQVFGRPLGVTGTVFNLVASPCFSRDWPSSSDGWRGAAAAAARSSSADSSATHRLDVRLSRSGCAMNTGCQRSSDGST